MLGKAFKKAVTNPVTGKNLSENPNFKVCLLFFPRTLWAPVKRWQVSYLRPSKYGEAS